MKPRQEATQTPPDTTAAQLPQARRPATTPTATPQLATGSVHSGVADPPRLKLGDPAVDVGGIEQDVRLLHMQRGILQKEFAHSCLRLELVQDMEKTEDGVLHQH